MVNYGNQERNIRIVHLISPEKEKEVLSSLKQWINIDPNLPKLSDKDLLHFLHASEYDLQRAKNRMNSHFAIRSTTSFFVDRDLQSKGFQKFKDTAYFFQLQGTAFHGEKVLLFKFNCSPSEFDYEACTRYSFAALDIFHEENDRQPGYIMLMDFDGIYFGHMLRMMTHMSSLRKELLYAQGSLPFRLTEVHILNTPSIVDSCLKIIKPMVAAHIWDYVFFHKTNNLEDIYSVVPQAILPKEYGGDGPSLKEHTEMTISKLLEKESFIKFKETQVLRTKNSELMPTVDQILPPKSETTNSSNID